MRGLSMRHAWRAAWRMPGLTVLVVLTLAFGIAVWLATSSLARAFEEDPLRDVAGLYRVELLRYGDLRAALAGTDMGFVSELPQLVLSEAEVRAFSLSPVPKRIVPAAASMLPVLPAGRPASLERARFVGPEAFALFGLALAAGRAFASEDPVARELVLSHEAARDWFGGDEAALGREVSIGGGPWRVVGVLAERAAAGRRIHFADGWLDPPVWLPYRAGTALRMMPSLRHPAPETDGGALHASLWVELPDASTFGDYARFASRTAATRGLPASSVRLRSYRDWSGVLGTPPTVRVFEVFGWVVLLACAFTLTRLLHTRIRQRTAEMAVRRAVGASRLDVVLELFAEASVVAALGAAAGVLLSIGVLAALTSIYPTETGHIHLPLPRMLVGLATGIGVGLLAAALPAWRLCREPVALALRRR